jgi:hypothetical protein
MTSESEIKLLKGSMNFLSEYRDKQSKDLARRLDFFVQSATKKYGSVQNIKKTGNEPVETEEDIKLIKQIINLKTFATIPFFSQDGKSITQIYTVGMWYYWGLPELVIKFEKPIGVNSGIEYVGILINIIHDTLFDMFKNKIIKDINNDDKDNKSSSDKTIGDKTSGDKTSCEKTNDDMINRIDFGSKNKSIYVNLENFDMSFKLCHVDESDYMDLKAYIMLWFYMYYMTADIDEHGTPKMYPVYRIDIKQKKYSVICENIAKVLMITRKIDKSESTSADNSNDSQNDSNDSEVENLDNDK